MIDLRLRTKITSQELDQKVGKIVTDADYNVLLTRACSVRKPDGQPLAVYLPAAVREPIGKVYAELSKIKVQTDNRGLAAGAQRHMPKHGGNRTRSKPVHSSILGAIDGIPAKPYCRLTAYSAQHLERWESLYPLLQSIAARFEQHVPARYAAQMGHCQQTQPDWVVPGTPFTTITVNNTYPTGVHTDRGDLDEGFSCLAVARRGDYAGGTLVFPEYRVGIDLQDGDLVLMDAHEWHGNTAIDKLSDDAARVSVVCYFRTGMISCGTLTEEEQKREQLAEARLAKGAKAAA